MKGIIFGSGVYGKKVLKGLQEIYHIEIVAYCDNDEGKWGKKVEGIPVISPKELKTVIYDKIFISIRRGYMFYAVKRQLIEMGIVEDDIEIMELSTDYQDAYLDERRRYIQEFAYYANQMGIKGNVAECGVYRGETAMFINKYFPHRKLYLMDSFEGFSEISMDYEKKYTIFAEGEYANNPYKNESAEELIKIVKTRMLYPENVIIKKGFFPESVIGLKDEFCFVNLDMDLYQPMFAGLEFFWEKMNLGGCILLHDFFNENFLGVQDAVKDFEMKIGKMLPKLPIGDRCSMAIIKN